MTQKPPSLDAMQEKAAEAADFMRLFSTPSRLILLCHIADKERSVGEIQEALDFKQPALSQQLAELRQAGVVQTRRASRQIYYSIADDRVLAVMKMLMQVFCAADADAAASEAKPAAPRQGTSATLDYPGEMSLWARLEG
ncbi:transcriptional regulator, ArsR family [Rhizobium sp. RU20A]|uniref:ArsR/SmtB family transcription factor n=1 Tax=Rhizobium sp. RU20A TaxID=1907412 RepID=UPI0009571ED4|nr:metalloregulator ArsR/SmtB family transcription factor [Rhizobium sp. RU20A]SIQ51490.1 transcriptional regulator, ArsR family [Rhizobium sp. RU20A]